MQVSSKTVVKIQLTLTEKEARWLMAYIQNPMCDPQDEPAEDAEMRKQFFNSIKSRLK